MGSKKLNVLITGAGGYLGSQIASYLDRSNMYFLRLLTSQSNLIQKLKLSNAEVICASFSEIVDFSNICDGMDAIIHLAAVDNKKCLEDPEFSIFFNVTQTMRLLNSALNSNVKRFIYMSTIHVYGSALKRTFGHLNLNITEETFPEPMSTYAITHKAAEDFVISISRQNKIEGCILRLSNSFGYPFLTPNETGWKLLVNELCKQAVTSKKLSLKSDGKSFLNFIPVSNICDLISKLLITNLNVNGIFNLGSSSALSVHEIAFLVAQRCKLLLNYEPSICIPLEYDQSARSDIPQKFVYSIKKLKNLGLLNDFSLEKEIDITISRCIENN